MDPAGGPGTRPDGRDNATTDASVNSKMRARQQSQTNMTPHPLRACLFGVRIFCSYVSILRVYCIVYTYEQQQKVNWCCQTLKSMNNKINKIKTNQPADGGPLWRCCLRDRLDRRCCRLTRHLDIHQIDLKLGCLMTPY